MKTKPFNLEEALNGAKVVTLDGREVTQLTKFNTDEIHCIYAVIDKSVKKFDIDGYEHYVTKRSLPTLMMAVDPISAWVNVYIDDNKIWLGHLYPSKEEAIEKITNRCTYIKTIQITDEL